METIKIADDSGFIAIVNSEKYTSFVDKNWTFPKLLEHFVNEMNRDTLIIWSTGMETEWTVSILQKPSEKNSYREFKKTISVSDGKLFLTNYEDLTMAAQFEDEKIPSEFHSHLYFKLDNGVYNITVRQMYDPDNVDNNSIVDTNFEIVVDEGDKTDVISVDNIFWWTP